MPHSTSTLSLSSLPSLPAQGSLSTLPILTTYPDLSSPMLPSLDSVQSPADIAEEKREGLLDMIMDVSGHCPICWYRNIKPDDHWAFHCPSGVCGKSQLWMDFKTNLKLGSGVCFRCGVPFDSPCNHPRPQAGQPIKGNCNYQDLLKEISFLIYNNACHRDVIFTALGVQAPKSLPRYKHWLSQTTPSHRKLSNFVEVLVMYWSLRSKGELPP
jgi:hypothetical protein